MRFPRGWQSADETTVLDPDVSFADTLPPPDETAVLRLGLSHADLADELDQERMARADAEEQVRGLRQERDDLRAEIVRLVGERQLERSTLVRERDDLGVRSLPSLPGAVLTDTDEPVGALIHDALVTETGVDPQSAEAPSEPLAGTWTPPPPTDWNAWTGSVGE